MAMTMELPLRDIGWLILAAIPHARAERRAARENGPQAARAACGLGARGGAQRRP
ncbi:hypothetical protein [Nonomuraea dietziae]|uniref:hypothetical protein n=1 Tax=Nonomuraea dietziae TaxID=65515 RepID=UPI0033E2DFAC